MHKILLIIRALWLWASILRDKINSSWALKSYLKVNDTALSCDFKYRSFNQSLKYFKEVSSPKTLQFHSHIFESSRHVSLSFGTSSAHLVSAAGTRFVQFFAVVTRRADDAAVVDAVVAETAACCLQSSRARLWLCDAVGDYRFLSTVTLWDQRGGYILSEMAFSGVPRFLATGKRVELDSLRNYVIAEIKLFSSESRVCQFSRKIWNSVLNI